MGKKVEKLMRIIFIGILVIPLFHTFFLENQVFASEKTLDLSFDKQPSQVGDQGNLLITTDEPNYLKVSVTPESGLELVKGESSSGHVIYQYHVLQKGKYKITVSNRSGNENSTPENTKSLSVEIKEPGTQETDASKEDTDSSIPSEEGMENGAEFSQSSTDNKKAEKTEQSINADQTLANREKKASAAPKGATVQTLSESNAAKLGNLWDYNAYLTGQHSANMADTEGAIAVRGDSVFPDDLQTFTYGASFRENNTAIGEPIREDQYVNVLLGGKIDNRATSEWVKPVVENRTTNGKTQGWLVARPTISDWIYKNLGEWFSAIAYKADDQIIDGAFAKLQAQEDQMNAKLDKLTKSAGKTVYEGSGYKLSASTTDSKVLILSFDKDNTPLEIKTLTIPDEFLKSDQYKQIVATSASKKIVMNGTSISGATRQDAGTYSALARKITFYFPNAQSITNYLEDDGSYPDTSKSGITSEGADNYGKDNGKNYYHSFTIGSVIAPNATVVYHSGSINGYVFAKNLHQRDGMEIHNFYNPWLSENEQPEVGSVTLHKQDSQTQTPLAGAEFGIRQKGATEFIDVQASDEQGNVSFEGIPYGEYEIIETKAPEGYELSTTIHKVTVSAQTSAVTLVAEDKKEAAVLVELAIHKSDQTTHADLSGAIFGLKGLREHDFIRVTTDKQGHAEYKNLVPGYYELVELTSPESYQIDEQPHIIYVGQEKKKSVIEFTNKHKVDKKGSIQLTKIDEATGKPLSGVEFGVREFGQKEFTKKKTDENGRVKFTELNVGAFYTVAELTSLNGYQLTPHPLIVRVGEGGQDVNIGNWTNKKEQPISQKGSLKIEKTDKATGKPLSKAVFGIRALGQKEYQKGETDSQGVLSFTDLSQGIYEVRELKAPAGYTATNLVKKVTVGYDPQDPITISKWENEQTATQLGSTKVIKTDDSGQPLANAEFAIRNDHERTFTKKAVTNESGEAYFNNLPFGKYEIIETKAPAGYQIDGTLHHIVVTNEQTDSHTLTVKDQKKIASVGQVSLEKRDKKTHRVLAGVEFNLEKSDGTVIKTYKTDKFGRIFVKDLAFGTYQFVEKKSLPGYELDTKPLPFTISRENASQLLTLTMVNKQKTDDTTKQGHHQQGTTGRSKGSQSSNSFYPKTNDTVQPLIAVAGLGITAAAIYLIFRKKQ
ncbi:SpaA isopeptide-forming pilin-related protein [Enterococcus sp. DIV0756]|uniref:SpaA isopeptide-forming pilin-related protein n=1 Tax=Enterococcus sp. DIV0756 TaxID=2774636 RepID=UPI003F23926C